MKKSKVSSTYRLEENTREQIKLMANYDGKSEAEIIQWAIERFYVDKYRREMPNKFPNLRVYPDYIIPYSSLTPPQEDDLDFTSKYTK